MSKECFQVIRSLQSDNDILITKPDKGASVVILNKHDYVSKMLPNSKTLFRLVKMTTQPRSSLKYNVDYWNWRRRTSSRYSLQSHPTYRLSTPTYVWFAKIHKKMYLYAPFCPWLAQPNINLQNISLLSLTLYSNFFYVLYTWLFHLRWNSQKFLIFYFITVSLFLLYFQPFINVPCKKLSKSVPMLSMMTTFVSQEFQFSVLYENDVVPGTSVSQENA